MDLSPLFPVPLSLNIFIVANGKTFFPVGHFTYLTSPMTVNLQKLATDSQQKPNPFIRVGEVFCFVSYQSSPLSLPAKQVHSSFLTNLHTFPLCNSHYECSSTGKALPSHLCPSRSNSSCRVQKSLWITPFLIFLHCNI